MIIFLAKKQLKFHHSIITPIYLVNDFLIDCLRMIKNIGQEIVKEIWRARKNFDGSMRANHFITLVAG